MKLIFYFIPFLAFTTFAQQPTASFQDHWNFDVWNGGTWEQNSGIDYTYTNVGKPLESTYKSYYFPDVWIGYMKHVSSYDGNARQALYTVEYNANEWSDTTYRTVYTYDAAGRIATETGQYYNDNSSWGNNVRYSYVYYGFSDQIASKTYQFWDVDFQTWINYSKYEYTYTSTVNHETFYGWDGWENGDWQPVNHSIISLNQEGQKTTEELQTMSNNVWTSTAFNHYTYNSFGKLDGILRQGFDPTIQQYYDLDSMRYEYNADQTLATETVVIYNAQPAEWQNYQRTRYIYDGQLNTNDETVITLSVYPNPASDQITLSSTENTPGTARIVDTQGRFWKTVKLTGTTSIAIDDLPQGMYLIQWQQAEHSETLRFVKQ